MAEKGGALWRGFGFKRRRPAARPSVPAGVRVYAIGDIHGCFDLLDRTLDRMDEDLKTLGSGRAVAVFLGDYVDRGPESAKVIERLIEIQITHRAICLRGNHDEMFKQFLDNPASLPNWATLGGLSTLMSYGLEPPLQPKPGDGPAMVEQLMRAMPDSHRKFLKSRPCLFECGDYVFVHAGVRPNIALKQQSEDDLLWIRDDFLFHEAKHEKIVVHGHTPVMEPDVRDNRINIDTGAFATGRLTCLVLEGTEYRFI